GLCAHGKGPPRTRALAGDAGAATARPARGGGPPARRRPRPGADDAAGAPGPAARARSAGRADGRERGERPPAPAPREVPAASALADPEGDRGAPRVARRGRADAGLNRHFRDGVPLAITRPMGTFSVRVEVGDSSAGSFVPVDMLVDTGSTFTV